MRELRNVTCIEDLRAIARRKVPRAFFDYAEAGSYSEQTLRANRAGLEAIKLAPARPDRRVGAGHCNDNSGRTRFRAARAGTRGDERAGAWQW